MRQHPTTGPGISPHSAYLYGRCVVAAVRLLGGVWGWDYGNVGGVWAMAGRLEAEFHLLDFRGT